MALSGSPPVLAALAGALSTLSPCVLPLLPVLLGGAVQQHRLAPLALAGGLATSFTGIGLGFTALGFAAGVDPAWLRAVSAVLMGVFGAVMLSPRLQAAFARLAGPLTGGANGLLARVSGEGLARQAGLGVLLGAVWSPCAGPTLGAAIGMAAGTGNGLEAAAIMALFSLGAVTPLLALSYGSRQAIAARRLRLAGLASLAKPALGGVLLATGLMIVSGADKVVETALTRAMPPWLMDLTTRF